jgi:hypothetical protein
VWNSVNYVNYVFPIPIRAIRGEGFLPDVASWRRGDLWKV